MRNRSTLFARRHATRPSVAPARRLSKLFVLKLVPALCAALALALTFATRDGLQARQNRNQNANRGANQNTQNANQGSQNTNQSGNQNSQQQGGERTEPADEQGDPEAAAETPTPTPTPYPETKVLRAYKLGRESGARSDKPAEKKAAAEAGLNDIVVLDVENLKALLEKSQCFKPGRVKDDDCDVNQRRITLYIEGRPLKGLLPESGAPELQDAKFGTLRFHLLRPEQSDLVSESDVQDTNEHWADLLGLSYDDLQRGRLLKRPVTMSVGLEGEHPVPTDVKIDGQTDNRFSLERLRLLRLFIWAALLGGFLVGFWRLARESDIIRDRKPIVWKRGKVQRKAYSLTRAQVAWWTFFVAYGFIFIWLVTGQRALSQSVLMLLGISVIPTAASIAIDKNRSFVTDTGQSDDEKNAELVKLMHKKEKLEQELIRDDGKIPADQFKAKEDEYKNLVAEIRQKFPTALGWENVRFDRDILSDANGLSIHRFQMVLWTVILGGIFIYEVVTRLAIPNFDPTLLLLMGISNGTYLFGKSSEPQATPPPTEDAADETPDSPPDEPGDDEDDETTSPP